MSEDEAAELAAEIVSLASHIEEDVRERDAAARR